MIQNKGAIPGSRASTEPSGLGPSGFDPGRRPMAALAQLQLELRLSEQLFRQYGLAHLDKADAVRDDDPCEFNLRMQKALRNSQRADCCKRALDFFESQGGIDGYAAIATEAGTAETENTGSVHEGAGLQGIAQHKGG